MEGKYTSKIWGGSLRQVRVSRNKSVLFVEILFILLLPLDGVELLIFRLSIDPSSFYSWVVELQVIETFYTKRPYESYRIEVFTWPILERHWRRLWTNSGLGQKPKD